jgi:hypothetical protein
LLLDRARALLQVRHQQPLRIYLKSAAQRFCHKLVAPGAASALLAVSEESAQTPESLVVAHLDRVDPGNNNHHPQVSSAHLDPYTAPDR